MKQNFKFIMVCAAAIAMVACAKEQAPVTEQGKEAAQGAKTYASVRILQSAPATRAYSEDTSNEKAVANAYLFIFNELNELESVNELTELDGDPNTIETYTGSHTLFVWANVPAALKTEIDGFMSLATMTEDEVDGQATSLDTFRALDLDLANEDGVLAITSASNTGAGDQFFMTNVGTSELTKTFVSEEGGDVAGNDVAIDLGRAVAKVSMVYNSATAVQPKGKDADGNPVALGTFSTMAYEVHGNPITMYAAQHFVDGVNTTPFHNEASVTLTNYFTTAQVLAATTKADPETCTYIPENTNKAKEDTGSVAKGEQTTLIIEAAFVPTASLVFDKDGGAGTYVPGEAFFRIKDTSTGNYLNNFYTESPTLSTAQTALGNPTAALGTNFTIDEWSTGKCYYRLPIQDLNKGLPIRYNILRNYWYRVDITSISGLGDAIKTNVVIGEEDKDEDADEPVGINATITVKDWTPVDQEGQL
jgi:hypothetical protein